MTWKKGPGFPPSRNPHLRAARLSIVNSMEPILAKCLRDNLLLINRHTGVVFTVADLRAAWQNGRLIMGMPNWRFKRTIEGLQP